MAAREDRQADDVHALVDGGAHDLSGRQADALVDDFHAAVARAHGDLLRAVGMSVEARLADQQLDAAAEARGHLVDLAAHGHEILVAALRHGAADAGRCAILAEDAAQGGAPLAGRDAGLGAGDRRLHDVAAFLGGAFEFGEGRLDGLGVTRGAPGLEAGDLLGLDGGIDGLDHGLTRGERGRLGLGPAVDADDDLLAALDAGQTLRVALDEGALHVVDGADGAPHLVDAGEFGLGCGLQLGDLGIDDARAVEDVAVFEKVRLVGEDLLHPDRPLLVPGPRQAQGLVPGGQLHGAGAGVLRQRDGQHLEQDAIDVVLGLRLGEA